MSHDNQGAYAVFLQNAKKGDCFVLETEPDWLVEFNNGLDGSLVGFSVRSECK